MGAIIFLFLAFLMGILFPLTELKNSLILLVFPITIVTLVVIYLVVAFRKDVNLKNQKVNNKDKLTTLFWLILIFCIVSIISSLFVESESNKKVSYSENETKKVIETTEETTAVNVYMEKVPYYGMSEDDINKTQLGHYTTCEKIGFDYLDKDHQRVEYKWEDDEGNVIFKATVMWDESKGWHVTDFADFTNSNNDQAIERAPIEGNYASVNDIARWEHHGNSSINGTKVTVYHYDVGNYSYEIYIDENNKILKVSTTIRGKK